MINERRKKSNTPENREAKLSLEEIPIINIIRHGETEYKEFQDSNYKIDPSQPGFKLDTEHLDLTPAGIKDIEETAQKLAQQIDPNKEVVLLVTSWQYRAISSILITERILQEKGIAILNAHKMDDNRRTANKIIGESNARIFKRGISEVPLRDKANMGPKWLDTYNRYVQANPDKIKSLSPAELHNALAAQLGKKLSDIFLLSSEEVQEGFNRFLRHMLNIKKYFQEETKQSLAGKRLRIVCITHEERVSGFAQESLNLKRPIKKGQMLEIKPKQIIGSSVLNQVTLFKKKKNEQDIMKNFKINLGIT